MDTRVVDDVSWMMFDYMLQLCVLTAIAGYAFGHTMKDEREAKVLLAITVGVGGSTLYLNTPALDRFEGAWAALWTLDGASAADTPRILFTCLWLGIVGSVLFAGLALVGPASSPPAATLLLFAHPPRAFPPSVAHLILGHLQNHSTRLRLTLLPSHVLASCRYTLVHPLPPQSTWLAKSSGRPS